MTEPTSADPAFLEPTPLRRGPTRKREWIGTLLSCGFVVAALAVFVPMLPAQDAITPAAPQRQAAVDPSQPQYAAGLAPSGGMTVTRQPVSYFHPPAGYAKHRI